MNIGVQRRDACGATPQEAAKLPKHVLGPGAPLELLPGQDALEPVAAHDVLTRTFTLACWLVHTYILVLSIRARSTTCP